MLMYTGRICDGAGRTAEDYARRWDHIACVRLLEQKAADERNEEEGLLGRVDADVWYTL